MLSVINQRFIEAAKSNKIDELKNLLDRGANIHANDDVALREAAWKGRHEIVKFLVTQGANIHADNDAALRWAAPNGHLEIAKFLLAKGANIHANDDGALREAAFCGDLEAVKFLVTQGANIHARNDKALKWSAQEGHNDVWQVLSAFIQEEKFLVAALGVTSASGWVCSTALGSVALVAAPVSTGASSCLCGMLKAQPQTITKAKRSKI